MGISSKLNPTLADAVETYTEYKMRQVLTAEPGRIVSYDKKHNRAEVELCIKGKLMCVDGMETRPAPLLPTVPVLWPRGGGSFITWPLKKGDYCLVIFQRKSIDQWCGKGGTNVDPVISWYHHYSDAVCLPGFYPYPEALAEEEQLDDAISLGFEDGSARLRVREDVVEVGGAADFVALAGKVMEELEALKAALATGIASLASESNPAGDHGLALRKALEALFLTWPSDVGASKARAS